MTTAASNQHIIRITAEQFKNVKVIDFMPNRYMTKISGANGAGKTSALDAVFYALLDRKTLSPTLIRQGQKKGFLRIETNTHIVTRHLDDKGGTLQIEVKATNTLVKAPDDWLEGIAGTLGFDPLMFMRLKPEDQFQELKRLVPMDADVDDLETRNEAAAERITARKAEAKRLEAARDHVSIDKSLPAEQANIEELLQKAREATDHNEAIERERNRRHQIEDDHGRRVATIVEKKTLLENLQSEIKNLEANAKQTIITISGWKPLEQPRDRAALDAKVSEATRGNSAIATNNANKAQRDRFEADVDAIKSEVTKLEEEVRTRKMTIASTLERAKFPIPGLSFETISEGSSGRERKNPKKIITYNGVPLSEASSAEQIRVSTAIGMAGKPELRFLLIRDGSLLDDNGLAILEQMAHENDYQILMEKVDTSGKIGIFMEDGTIKTVNAEPEAKAEPSTPKKTTRKNKAQGELIS
jgi:AAA domain